MVRFMKKKLFKSLLIIPFISVLALASCGSSSNSSENNKIVNSTDNINYKEETKKKYVIELNKDNYRKYIDVRSNGGSVYFIGTLSYAFYDNVIIYSLRSGGETSNPIELSAGGYASWYITGYGSYTVTAVSGKVIYWI